MSSNWAFTKKPFWIFSHVFVLSSAVLFVVLGLWQFDRLEERKEFNLGVLSAQNEETIQISGSDLNEQLPEWASVEIAAKTIESDFIRVVNRTRNGVVGEHVVALVEVDQTRVFLNRGFVPRQAQIGGLPDEFFAVGRVRRSVDKGFFDVADAGDPDIAPRLNVSALSTRVEGEDSDQIPAELAASLGIESSQIAPVWIQLATIENSTPGLPTPLGLPEISEGSHFSYAIQWLVFSALTPLFYVLILRRRSSKNSDPTPT